MRARFVVALVALVLAGGLASYGLVHARLSQVTRQESERSLMASRERVAREVARLELEAGDAAARAATDASLTAALRARGSDRRHAVFSALTQLAQEFAAERAGLGRPDLLVAVDPAGFVIARDVDADAWAGRNLGAEWPVVARGARSSATGIVQAERRAYLVAAHAAGSGSSVVLGYALGDGAAERLSSAANADVVLFRGGHTLGSSERGVERRRLLEGGALTVHRAEAEAALAGADGEVVEGAFPSLTFSYLHGRIRVGREAVGVVVANDDRVTTRLLSVADLLLFLTAIVGLAAVALAIRLADMVLRPIFALERTLAAMIEGDRNPPLDLFGTPLGGVAYRVHELVMHLVPPESRRPTGGASRLR